MALIEEEVDIHTVAKLMDKVKTSQQGLQDRVKKLQERVKLSQAISVAPNSYFAYATHPYPCGQCGIGMISGMRYKCRLCQEFNLCGMCMAASTHEHSEFVAMPFEGSHENTGCDGCGQVPLQGIRYNCPICGSFDLCHSCKLTMPHRHNSWRIISPIRLVVDSFVNESTFRVGQEVIITVVIRNHSQEQIGFLTFIVENGVLPFQCPLDFAYQANPGDTGRILLVGNVTEPPGNYEVTLRLFLPEINEMVGKLQLTLKVVGKGLFQKVKSFFH